MQRNLIFSAVFAAFSLCFSQVTLAEESSSFVAHNAVVSQQRADIAQPEAVVKQVRADEARDS